MYIYILLRRNVYVFLRERGTKSERVKK